MHQKVFHVLSRDQILSKKALHEGEYYCIKNGYFEELKIIVNNFTFNSKYERRELDRKYFSLFLYSCKYENKDILIFLYDKIKYTIKNKKQFKLILFEINYENIIYLQSFLTKEHKKIFSFGKWDFFDMLDKNVSDDIIRYLYAIKAFNINWKDEEIYLECIRHRRYNLVTWIQEKFYNKFEYFCDIFTLKTLFLSREISHFFGLNSKYLLLISLPVTVIQSGCISFLFRKLFPRPISTSLVFLYVTAVSRKNICKLLKIN